MPVPRLLFLAVLVLGARTSPLGFTAFDRALGRRWHWQLVMRDDGEWEWRGCVTADGDVGWICSSKKKKVLVHAAHSDGPYPQVGDLAERTERSRSTYVRYIKPSGFSWKPGFQIELSQSYRSVGFAGNKI
ncbi:hypothetical protein B0H12DRAFT_1218304 [Mycena haematopus]|nr:hypothetical protein B0H12DRAFT_1218304 [Mycena haematopus]